MIYFVNWYLSETNHQDYPTSVEIPLAKLVALVLQLKTRNQVIYVNNVIPEGRLLIWGKNETTISLELQFSAHWYDRDIAKSAFEEYMTNIEDIAARPEAYGFNFGE